MADGVHSQLSSVPTKLAGITSRILTYEQSAVSLNMLGLDPYIIDP
jgi:hypothetical protein